MQILEVHLTMKIPDHMTADEGGMEVKTSIGFGNPIIHYIGVVPDNGEERHTSDCEPGKGSDFCVGHE
jgi:hypothetical protein